MQIRSDHWPALLRSLVPTVPAVLLAGMALLAACSRDDHASVIRITAVETAATTAASRTAPSPLPDGAAGRATIFLDAGHGGSDPGWGSQNLPGSLPEKHLTLDVARRTAAYLEQAGYHVVLSRTEDIQLNDPKRDLNGDGCIDPIDEIQARIDKANATNVAVLLSFHFNGSPNPQLSGSGTFYNAVRDFGERNRRLAALVQEAQLATLSGFGHQARDWGAIRDDSIETGNRSECATSPYFALIGPALPGRPRPSQMTGVIIEALFLTNPPEAALANRAEVRDTLAKAYAEAVQRFLTGAGG